MTGLLAKAVEVALIGWLALLALVVALRILRGDIPLNGLLSTRKIPAGRRRGRRPSPGHEGGNNDNVRNRSLRAGIK
jgi:hypothetical protein